MTQTLASQLDRSSPLVSTPSFLRPGFSVLLSVTVSRPFFRLLASDFRFWFFQYRRNCQIQTCTGSQCGFCGCVALSATTFLTPVYAINIFLRSCTSGSYVVTKGNSVSLLLSFFFSADCLKSKLTSDKELSVSC